VLHIDRTGQVRLCYSVAEIFFPLGVQWSSNDPVKRLPQAKPRPMQQNAHVAVGDFKDFADFLCLQTLLSAQDQNGPLRRGQLVYCVAHMVQNLASIDNAFRPCLQGS
jgi:hypothetical protein